MKPSDKDKYSEEEQIDRLLGGRVRETTPEFEARWVALKRGLRQAPARRRSVWGLWTAWVGGAAVAGAALVAVVALRGPERTRLDARNAAAVEASPVLEELYAMDAVLSRARVLLDDEQRAALLNIQVDNTPKI